MQQIGRYEIIRELGRGSMGVVYAAIDPLIGRMVAIKTIRLDTQGSEENQAELTRRLYREAQSAGILSHPGIITIHDIGERANIAYIVMEYVSGTNLEDLIASGVPQHSATLFSILKQTASALDYAHSKGIIHRDIKPSNIMICQDGSVKIADFGVAKLSASTSMTQAGLVLGTPSYMSPEQAQGLAITGRTDLFSLAVVAYRVLTGALPFHGPTLTAILTKILIEEPHYESSGLHPLLQSIFRTALAKDPAARFQSCAEFIQELERAHTSSKSAKELHALIPEEHTATLPGALDLSPITLSEQQNELKESSVSAAISTGGGAAKAPLPEAQKAKSRPIFWMACLAVLAIAVLAFFGFRVLQKPVTTGQGLHSNKSIAAPAKPAPAEPAAKPTVSSKPAPSSANVAASSGGASAKSTLKVAARNSAPAASGTLIWTGKLDKNSVLVISQRQASIGSMVGELPGKPVTIELEPGDVLVRQMPGPENQWKQIILYSGANRYRSITLYWKTTS